MGWNGWNGSLFVVSGAQDFTCVPYECSEGSMEMCRICTRPDARTDDNQCYQCNPGLKKEQSWKSVVYPSHTCLTNLGNYLRAHMSMK